MTFGDFYFLMAIADEGWTAACQLWVHGIVPINLY